MPQIGYALSSEEFPALDLVRFAQRAEQAGFEFALISDHFHPWTRSQGQSPFVWGVIGGIAAGTTRLRLGTGVTCPLLRIHPAIIAQAAATAASMMPDRFFLGVGTGENLNEHILGDRWPGAEERRERLVEAIEVIRLLWGGGLHSHRGRFYRVENAQLFSLPQTLPPIMIAASGEKSAELARKYGDGLICAGGDAKVVKAFGKSKPRYNQITVCWNESEDAARKMVHDVWPITSMEWPLITELALPSHFEAAAKMVRESDLAESVVCGPDPQKHIDAVRKSIDAGFDHVYVHQVGPDQEGFFRFYESEVLPEFQQGPARKAG